MQVGSYTGWVKLLGVIRKVITISRGALFLNNSAEVCVRKKNATESVII
jgi:hypothetical protein